MIDIFVSFLKDKKLILMCAFNAILSALLEAGIISDIYYSINGVQEDSLLVFKNDKLFFTHNFCINSKYNRKLFEEIKEYMDFEIEKIL